MCTVAIRAKVVKKQNKFNILLGDKYVNRLSVVFPKNMRVENEQTNRVIWLGKNVPLEIARVTIREALVFNPYICFVHVVGDRGEKPPEKVNNTIHVGGSEEAAMVMKLAAIPATEIQHALDQAMTSEELHRFFHNKNAVKK